MKKVRILLNESEYRHLKRILENAKKKTGYRCSVSDVIRALLIKESRRIPKTQKISHLLFSTKVAPVLIERLFWYLQFLVTKWSQDKTTVIKRRFYQYNIHWVTWASLFESSRIWFLSALQAAFRRYQFLFLNLSLVTNPSHSIVSIVTERITRTQSRHKKGFSDGSV